MRFTFGPLEISVKNTYVHGQSVYYQRHVPADLRDRYGARIIKRNLGPKDQPPTAIARKVAEWDRALDAEYAGLRAAPDSTPAATQAQAIALLRRWGLQPAPAENHPVAVDLLHDHLDTKRVSFAGGDEEVYRGATPSEYLTPTERVAWQALHGSRVDTIKDAFAVYLGAHVKGDDKKFSRDVERAEERIVALLGDKAVSETSREDARRLVAYLLDSGIKTTSVRRYIHTYRAVWTSYAHERSPHLPNIFARIAIKGEGLDSTQRGVYAPDALSAIVTACVAADDDIRWLIALQVETGMRIAEVAGCELADFKLNGDTPHIELRRHPWRDTKTHKPRSVALVGVSLWAARRIVETATPGQRFAFPRYTGPNKAGEIECKGTHASNTACKWLKGKGFEAGTHAFRHTIKDRLREVGCPKDLHDRITGHATQDVGDDYGRSQLLQLQRDWLDKVALKVLA